MMRHDVRAAQRGQSIEAAATLKQLPRVPASLVTMSVVCVMMRQYTFHIWNFPSLTDLLVSDDEVCSRVYCRPRRFCSNSEGHCRSFLTWIRKPSSLNPPFFGNHLTTPGNSGGLPAPRTNTLVTSDALGALPPVGKWIHTAGKFAGIPEDQGIQMSSLGKLHAIAAKLPQPVIFGDEGVVLQSSLMHSLLIL
jgi:hypothetical protein